MTRKWPIFALSLALSAWAIPARLARAADVPMGGAVPDDSAAARSAFEAGLELYKRGEIDAACRVFRGSWSLQRRLATAINLGQCEMALEQYPAAAEHLTYALRELPTDAPGRATLEAALAQARSSVAALHIVAPAGATIVVDGMSPATAPLTDPLFVAPGPYTARAIIDDEVVEKQGVAVRGGEDTIEFTRRPPPAPAPAVEAAPSSPSWAPEVALGGSAALLLGVGTGLLIASDQMTDDIRRQGRAITGYCSPDGNDSAQCQALRDRLDEQRRLDIAGVVLDVAGGAAAVAFTVVLIRRLTRSTAASQPSTAALTPAFSLGQDQTWVGVHGRF